MGFNTKMVIHDLDDLGVPPWLLKPTKIATCPASASPSLRCLALRCSWSTSEVPFLAVGAMKWPGSWCDVFPWQSGAFGNGEIWRIRWSTFQIQFQGLDTEWLKLGVSKHCRQWMVISIWLVWPTPSESRHVGLLDYRTISSSCSFLP